MVSYAQLEAEQWWNREIVTTELDWLGDQLCAALGRPRSAFGAKGDNVHLNGGHRSQEWLLRSIHCTNRGYTVQSGLSADQLRHISAGDFTPGAWGTLGNRQLVAAQTRRLWDEAVAGNLPGVVEIQGTLNGTVTAGINLISGVTLRPSSSHLDHWHVRMDRRYLRDAGLMSKILKTVLAGGDDMSDAYNLLDDLIRVEGNHTFTPPGADGARYGSLSNAQAVAAIQRAAKDSRLAADGIVQVLAAVGDIGAVTLTPEQLEELAVLVAERMPATPTPDEIVDVLMDRLKKNNL